MANDVDELKAYSEACNTLRHYSNASLTVRLASVVQGIAILVAWTISLTQKNPSLMIGRKKRSISAGATGKIAKIVPYGLPTP